jgi:hypothetical protein
MLQNTFVSNTYLPPDLVLIIHIVGISIAVSVPFVILAFSVNHVKDWLTNAFSRRSLRMSLWDLFVTIVVILYMTLKPRLPFQRRKKSYNSSYSSSYSSYTGSVRTATGTDAISERPPPPTTQLSRTRKICGALSWWGARTTAPSTDVEAAQANVTDGLDEKTEERLDRPEDMAEKQLTRRVAQARAADDGDIVEVVSVSEGSSRSPRGSRRRSDRSRRRSDRSRR